MNIIVRPFGSKRHYCRPDTTWERESRDIYIPEGIDEVYWTPIVFIRVCKAGKCIGKKFASRYYDAFNFGALLYMGDGQEYAFTSCADHSSILPYPLNENASLTGSDSYEVHMNGTKIYEYLPNEELTAQLEEALCQASQFTSLRIGDHIAMELEVRKSITKREDPTATLESIWNGKQLFATKLIF